ncbi:MAG TPA: glycosyltransferase [Thermoanaerobaculia bacterium]|nr:glycosyltransferase [Thermoanaerobaculia bacterium]
MPHLLHVFSNFVPTGPELRTVELIGAFGRGFRHSIVSMDGRTSAADRLSPNTDVRLLPEPPKAGSFATARRLRKLLGDEKPDLVLTYGWGAFDTLLAARSLGFRRVIHHEEGFNEDEAEQFKGRRIWARRLVLPGAAAVVVPSERLKTIAVDLWRLQPERVRLIPNGIRLDRFAPGEARTGPLVVGTVGSLRAVKNHARLLEAVARVPDIHLLLVGDGEERPALERRAAAPDLAGRVRFAGYQESPAPFYQAMDVFALSSDSEQMPVALLEAMASALPVVSTDVGDVRAMLPPEQAPFLGADLAGPLAELASAPDLRRQLGDLNRKRAEERYSFEALCAAYRELYESVLIS